MIDVLTEIIINTHINIMMFELGPFEVKMHRKQTPFNLFILFFSEVVVCNIKKLKTERKPQEMSWFNSTLTEMI